MNTEATSPATRHSGDWHPDEKDAFSVEETAHKLDLGRSIIYRALNLILPNAGSCRTCLA